MGHQSYILYYNTEKEKETIIDTIYMHNVAAMEDSQEVGEELGQVYWLKIIRPYKKGQGADYNYAVLCSNQGGRTYTYTWFRMNGLVYDAYTSGFARRVCMKKATEITIPDINLSSSAQELINVKIENRLKREEDYKKEIKKNQQAINKLEKKRAIQDVIINDLTDNGCEKTIEQYKEDLLSNEIMIQELQDVREFQNKWIEELQKERNELKLDKEAWEGQIKGYKAQLLHREEFIKGYTQKIKQLTIDNEQLESKYKELYKENEKAAENNKEICDENIKYHSDLCGYKQYVTNLENGHSSKESEMIDDVCHVLKSMDDYFGNETSCYESDIDDFLHNLKHYRENKNKMKVDTPFEKLRKSDLKMAKLLSTSQ